MKMNRKRIPRNKSYSLIGNFELLSAILGEGLNKINNKVIILVYTHIYG